MSTPFEVKLYDCFFTSVNPRSLGRVSLIDFFLHLIIADAYYIPFGSSGLTPLGFLVSILPDNMLKLSPGYRVKGQVVLASGGISLIHSAGAMVIAVSTSRKAGAQLVLILPQEFAPHINEYSVKGNVLIWLSVKAIQRKTTGTGRMWHLRDLPRRFKDNFREGSQAPPKVKAAAT
ncbi:unnamed protein product [Sphagnum compactum]